MKILMLRGPKQGPLLHTDKLENGQMNNYFSDSIGHYQDDEVSLTELFFYVTN